MRVAFVNPAAELGGAERSIVTLLEALPASAPDIGLHLILGDEGPLAEEARALGVPVSIVPLPQAVARVGEAGLRVASPLSTVGQLPRVSLGVATHGLGLARVLLQLAPDIIHTNGLKSHLIAAAVRPGRSRLVWHLQDFIGQRRLGRPLLSALRPRAHLVIADSEAVASDARAHLPGIPVTAVYNSVDTERFSPGPADGEALDQLAGFPPAERGTVRIGLVATYAIWKGHEVFLRAAGLLADQLGLPPMRFYVVGGPVYRTSGSQRSETGLRRLAAEVAPTAAVGLVPFQRETAAIYRALDVVVHASTEPEPFGLVIAEAMACGRSVVVARAGGAAELFTEGLTALGHTPGDPASLAAAVRRLAAEPALRRRLGSAARAHAVERFPARRFAEDVIKAYESVIHHS